VSLNLTLGVNTLLNVPQTTTLFDYTIFHKSYPEYESYKFVPQDDELPIELAFGSDSFWHLYNTIFGWALVGQPPQNNHDIHPISTFFVLKLKQALDQLCALTQSEFQICQSLC